MFLKRFLYFAYLPLQILYVRAYVGLTDCSEKQLSHQVISLRAWETLVSDAQSVTI